MLAPQIKAGIQDTRFLSTTSHCQCHFLGLSLPIDCKGRAGLRDASVQIQVGRQGWVRARIPSEDRMLLIWPEMWGDVCGWTRTLLWAE